jgi:hypothetical protein
VRALPGADQSVKIRLTPLSRRLLARHLRPVIARLHLVVGDTLGRKTTRDVLLTVRPPKVRR